MLSFSITALGTLITVICKLNSDNSKCGSSPNVFFSICLVLLFGKPCEFLLSSRLMQWLREAAVSGL